MLRSVVSTLGLLAVVHAMAAIDAAYGTPPSIVSVLVPDAELVGTSRLRFFIWNVYDARLFAPKGEFRRDAPFALALSYLRSLDGEAIAERSIVEIREQGFDDEAVLARWYDSLREILPDVDSGTVLIGVADERGYTRFFENGRPLGTISDREFTRRFFDIWVGERCSRPDLRDELLGKDS